MSQLKSLQTLLTHAYSIELMGERFGILTLLVCASVIALVALSRRVRAGRCGKADPEKTVIFMRAHRVLNQ